MAQLSGYFAVAFSAVLFGAGTMIIKITYQSGLTPEIVLIMQIGLAVVISWGVVVLRNHKNFIPPRSLWGALALQGAIAGCVTSMLFFQALDRLGADLATLLLFTFPAFVALYQGIWGKTAVKKFQITALLMAFVGLLLVVDIFHTTIIEFSGAAIFIGIGAAITNAFGSIHGEKLLTTVDAFVVTAWSYTFSFITLLCLYRPEWIFHMNFSDEQGLLLILGAIFNFAPLVFYFLAITRIGAGIASIISTFELPIALVFAYVFLGETMTGIQIMGGFLITASVFLLYYKSWKSAE